MKRVRQEERRVRLEDGRELGLDYWLLTENTCWGESYGLSVTDTWGGEATIRHVTTDRKEAVLLLKCLAAGTVTTLTVPDIVEDFLAR